MLNKRLTVGMVGEDVAALQRALSALGLSIPEAETKRRFFGPATRQAVCECQTCHGLEATGEVNEATAAALLARAPSGIAASASAAVAPVIASRRRPVSSEVQPKPSPPLASELFIPESGIFVVRGTVESADGQPLSGAVVRAFDRDLRKEQPLGAAKTDDRGQYIIRYGSEHFATGDVPLAPAPKLIVRAFLGDLQIADDVTRPQPTRDEVVNFKVPAPALSEWERVCAGVIPLLKGQGEGDQTLPPWEINDSDLNFIAEETGLEREKIRLWALAFAVARDAAVVMEPAGVISARGAWTHALPVDDLLAFAIFYGWFRQGMPTELSALWAVPTDTLITTLRASIEQQIVPPISSSIQDNIQAQIEQLKLDLVLRAPALGTTASLGDLLATLPTPLNLDQQRVIAAAVTDLRLDDTQLVNRIADISGFDGDAVGVARTLRLGALTGGHVPLAQALQHRPQLAEEPEGTLRPLAALRPDEWLDLAYAHGTPNGSAITPVAYADALAASVELQYPTAALAAHLTDGRRLAQQPALTHVGTFLRDNPTFDIVTANLNVLAEPAEPGGVAEPKQLQLVEGLQALQRMHVLEASWEETATLLENDLHSPHQLLAAGPGQLTALLDGQFAPERATALYRQAEGLHNVTFAAITAALSPLSGPQVLPGQYSVVADGREINPNDLGGVDPSIPAGPFPDDDDSGGSAGLKILTDVLASRGGRFDPKNALTLRELEPPEIAPVFLVGPELDLGGVIDHQPTLRTLFGDQDACACGHCSSVLSPAAYFVDVLQFIKNAKLRGRLLARLLKRRPDLQDLELSCNNTNTVVPAIDLALEVLENAVALPLDVPLPAGTDVEAQLSGPTVGAEVESALKKTVRNLTGEVRATQEGDAWTVVDGHRRWKLTAQAEALYAEEYAGWWPQAAIPTVRPLDTRGLNLSALIAALDQGRVASGAEAAFARLFAANQVQPPDLTNYAVTITPLVAGKWWHVEYQFVGQLVTVIDAGTVVLQTPVGVVWWDQAYSQATIAAIEDDLSSGTVPELVQGLLASRFSKAPASTVTSAGGDMWTIASAKRELTLGFTPARLTITSLAYQSGDPDADALAWPENHNPAAYAQLKKANFPWSLPVDLPLEEVRLFLERARSSRRRLIELMMPVDRLPRDDAVLALEVLG